MVNEIRIKLLPEHFDLKPTDFIKYRPESNKPKVEPKNHIKKDPEIFNWNEDDCMSDEDLWAKYYGYM